MRLLFDQNLPPRPKRNLGGLFPGALHVRDVGLATAEDLAIWEYAKGHGDTDTAGLLSVAVGRFCLSRVLPKAEITEIAQCWRRAHFFR